MRWIEIIQLRVTERSASSALVDALRGSLEEKRVAFAIYRHAVVASDLGVHLVHETDGDAGPDRTLAERLAATLEAYGLVHRSLWKQIQQPSGERRSS